MEIFTLGERILVYRKRLKLSTSETAEKLSISEQSLKRYENDDEIPDEKTIVNLADLFDVSVDRLLYGI